MAYQLRYYKEFSRGRDIFRLEIFRDYLEGIHLTAYEIGDVVAGLKLDIQGQTEDIDAPIVKTTLTLSLVDAPEKNGLQRWGDWEEFYTPNSVEWKVVLLVKKVSEAHFRPFWSGYVTPDSYMEQLQYHGVVSVVARDNIGHLQDFDFDAVGNTEGMITPRELITEAWSRIASPMSLEWYEDDRYPQCEGVPAVDAYMNVSAFEGKTWFEAVEETLYSLGLAMRWCGFNNVCVSSLRDLPLQSRTSMGVLNVIAPQFEAYGTRELVPAVREIEDVVTYDLPDEIEQPKVREEDFTGSTVSAIVKVKNIFGEVSDKSIAVWPIANEGPTGWGNLIQETLFFNPFNYSNQLRNKSAIDEEMFLAVNTEPGEVWYGRTINCQPMTVRVEQGTMIERYGEDLLDTYGYTVNSLKASVMLTQNGISYFYNGGSWVSGYQELTIPFEDGVAVQELSFQNLYGSALLQFYIHSIDVTWSAGYPDDSKGVFLGLKSFSIAAPEYLSLREKNTVRTVYNEVNNVRMRRTPALGPAYDVAALPGFITNGIYVKEGDAYVPAPEWKWEDEEDAVQLGVLVHQQLLCYHSKPNNLLSGTILNADLYDIRTLWTWKEKEHLLLSGTLDFLNGRIDGAVLREFRRYDDMW
jgi:hypothetical protein